MTIHDIHLPHRNDRLEIVMKELESQKIADYKIWEGIVDPVKTRRDNDKLLLLFTASVVYRVSANNFSGHLRLYLF